MTNDIDLAKAFLDHSEMEFVRAYLGRGRLFQSAPPAGVEEAWAIAFKLVCGHGDASHSRQLQDLTAELRLRGSDLPEHLVQDTIRLAHERFRELPEVLNDILQEMIGRFLDEMDKPKN